ncbi:helix-turn-helix transcriptional regulator [Actinomycetaceae bacterium MB13-C1-2]|nr:helix-turn-helix transcriptional regulator [Actinomycetaceae bacterium MB13-C1-2]
MNSNATEGAGHPSTEPVDQIYTVSVAAELAGMHAQTLRQYDRLGLVSPERAKGRGRRYSGADVRKLVEIQSLTQDQGVNLAGVALILELRDHIEGLHTEIEQLRQAIASTSVPPSRVFTADAAGDVRLRPPKSPTEADSELANRPEPDREVITAAKPISGKSVVPAATAFGWQRLALLQLSRIMQGRGQ